MNPDAILVASIVLVGWVISVCFHEFAHAFVAYLAGDKTVKSKGYLNFNPFVYSDIRLSVILPTLFILIGGIGLPGASVRIREDQLRHPKLMSLVAAAGPLATLLFAIAVYAVIRLGVLPGLWTLALCWLLNLEIVVLILNLLPIPGLDGFGIIDPFFSRQMKQKVEPLYKHGFTFLIILLWIVPGPNQALWRTGAEIMDALRVHPLMIYRGEELYRQGSLPLAVLVIAVAALAYFANRKNDWSGRGQALMAKGQFKECLQVLESADQKVRNADYYRMLAVCCGSLYELSRKNCGESKGEKSADPSEPSVNLALDSSAEAAQDKQSDSLIKAYAAAQKCVDMEPTIYENWIARAYVCHEMFKLEEAVAAYRQVLKLNPTNDFAFVNLCRILCGQNSFAELLEVSEQFSKDKPGDLEAVFFKAVALAGLERLNEALPLLQQCSSKGLHKEECRALSTKIEEALTMGKETDD